MVGTAFIYLLNSALCVFLFYFFLFDCAFYFVIKWCINEHVEHIVWIDFTAMFKYVVGASSYDYTRSFLCKVDNDFALCIEHLISKRKNWILRAGGYSCCS